PAISAFSEDGVKDRWDARGVCRYTDYRAMLRDLGDRLDVVTVPTPIHLHAEMHRACVESGVACYLEKPPSLDPEEFAGMLRMESQAPQSTTVGFQKTVDPLRREWKRRLVRGDFGRVLRVSYLGLAPRGSDYYARNNWAGRLIRDGRLLLDSCVGNALSHFLHAMLYSCGSSVDEWAAPATAESEMIRAHPIEGPDSVFARGTCANGVEWRIAASHACLPEERMDREVIECEQARLTLLNQAEWRIEWRNGKTECGVWPAIDQSIAIFSEYLSYLKGEMSRPPVRLADTESYVQLHSLLYLAADGIDTAPPSQAWKVPSPANLSVHHVSLAGVRKAAEQMTQTGRLPSEQGLPWGRPGRWASLADIPHLRTVLTDRSFYPAT
ncbi:MAG: Gfo/Idh/MocA family oxidoreductase, partial [Kiritimatiellia bacterium]|nr:Gfo/Idh/MocA family oxidoreductase [Kiritimatiellia bacterium]